MPSVVGRTPVINALRDDMPYDQFVQIQLTGRFSGIEGMLSFFPLSVCLSLVMAGMGLGFAGSVVSLLRIGEGRA